MTHEKLTDATTYEQKNYIRKIEAQIERKNETKN